MAPATVNVDLVNQTGQDGIFAYVTGTEIASNRLVLLEADGHTLYYPNSPSDTNQPLQADCGIALGGPGATRTVTIPQMAGGRVWFSYGQPLTFLLNPGNPNPGLVEPSVSNPADPNINIRWGFCEFTFNPDQLFGNISYVDFFSIPIAMDLQSSDGSNQHVSGTGVDGLNQVASGLRSQEQSEGVNWSALIVEANGQPLRILSPNQGLVGNPNLFANYWDGYINQVWAMYSGQDMLIDTQVSYGTVSGRTNGDTLTFSGGASFQKPTGTDIWNNSTGPFAQNSPEQLAIIPRIAAGFNRSVLHQAVDHPNGENTNDYYKQNPTNHYSRLMHEANLDGLGYAFPYDDVTGDNNKNQAGVVFSGDPVTWTITVGGNNAHV